MWNWLPSQDSNLGKRIQSPLCYHYTTRQSRWCRRSDSNRHESYPSTVFETVASAISPLRLGVMERKTGFEPAALSLARRCSTTEPLPHLWCRGPESNWGHADFQSAALPPELPRQHNYSSVCPMKVSRRCEASLLPLDTVCFYNTMKTSQVPKTPSVYLTYVPAYC